MKKISLLPADTYIVINKTTLTDIDKKNLINLYEPIIGCLPISLYLTLWYDLDKYELLSKDYTHHHLMTILKLKLDCIKEARDALESVGLIKTFLKKGDDINSYIYELYSPLSGYEFFNHPILNIILYNNIGANEYDSILKLYKKPSYNYSDYENISQTIDCTFESSVSNLCNNEDIQRKTSATVNINALIDFDYLLECLPNKIINPRTLNKKTKEFINDLAFVYNLDTLKMGEIIRLTLNENGIINKELLQKETRKYYEYNNSGSLPTLVYRTQPDYLKTPEGDTSNKGKMIYIFENTTPYDFLRNKYKTGTPTSQDLKLIEYLAVELNMTPAVINVLVDYVLRINDNKLTKSFVETIAGQWARLGIKTAKTAMDQAEKEYKKRPKIKAKTETKLPVWFNETNIKDEISETEKKEMEMLLKEFR